MLKILTEPQLQKIEVLAVSLLADYIQDHKIQTIVLGISGGLDSAVMAAIGLKAIDKLKQDEYHCDYIFDFINVESNKDDLEKARELAKTLNFRLGEYDYTNWYQMSPIRQESHLGMEKIRTAKGNLKCRMRMLHLYDRAQLFRGVVLDTDDLSELLMGFWTKHGDVGDVKVIQHLTKDEVRDLGEYMGVCWSILDSAPGDGLGVTPTNRAIDQLKMSYLKIDYVISRMIQNELDINGHTSQLYSHNIWIHVPIIADEIGEPRGNVEHVVHQSLSTAFKRVGDDAVLLINNRKMMGLPELGTREFNRIFLSAIKKQ